MDHKICGWRLLRCAALTVLSAVGLWAGPVMPTSAGCITWTVLNGGANVYGTCSAAASALDGTGVAIYNTSAVTFPIYNTGAEGEGKASVLVYVGSSFGATLPAGAVIPLGYDVTISTPTNSADVTTDQAYVAWGIYSIYESSLTAAFNAASPNPGDQFFITNCLSIDPAIEDGTACVTPLTSSSAALGAYDMIVPHTFAYPTSTVDGVFAFLEIDYTSTSSGTSTFEFTSPRSADFGAAVPEPAAISLVLCGALLLPLRNRSRCRCRRS